MSVNIYDKNTGELTKVAGNSRDPNITFPETPAGKFLKDNNTWDDVPNPSVAVGATATTDGESGLVPQPLAGDQDKFLSGDGSWKDIPKSKNTLTISTKAKCEIQSQGDWEIKQWYAESSDGSLRDITSQVDVEHYLWSDGNDVYLSMGSSAQQYKLDKTTSIWKKITWNGEGLITGQYIWSDGENIYHSAGAAHHVLDKSTSTWTNISERWKDSTGNPFVFSGSGVWSNGGHKIYYTTPEKVSYTLDGDTWSRVTWMGYSDIDSSNIWTDGVNVYYSNGSAQYTLDSRNNYWKQKSWTLNGSAFSFYGNRVWTDGNNIYNSYYSPSLSNHCILDKTTSTWSQISWNTYIIDGSYIWSDGENIYFNNETASQILKKKTIY